MKKTLSILTAGVLLLAAVQAGLAQDGVPLAIIHCPPDAATAPPEVRTYISVVDWEEAESVEGLTAEDFVVEEDGDVVEIESVSYETAGLAVVLVVDRGGISAPEDGRIAEATGLAEDLIGKLSAPGGSGDDMVAVVGIGEDGMDPLENFTFEPVDTGRAKNALIPMVGKTVSGGTPLYEGLDVALGLLTENTDAKISDALASRRKVVVVFSDGIDPDFSETTRYDDVIRKAVEADVPIYTVGMAKPDSELSAADNLKRLAHQTKGVYQLHNDDESHAQVLDLFDRMVTQRQQYLITYETRLPKGSHTFLVSVRALSAVVEAEVPFISVLEPLQISLTAPVDGGAYTVPITYDEVPCLYRYTKRENFRYDTPTTISLSVEVTQVDGAFREPAEVRYYASGDFIGSSTSAPTYDFTWEVLQTHVVTPTEQPQEERFTLTARASDPYLGDRMESQEVTVVVTWKAMEQTQCVEWEGWVYSFWWVICIVGVLALGLFVLLVMLIRTRGELARKVVTRTTGVLKGVTKRLGGMPDRAPGKLVVTQGANVGREFRLAAPVVKVGRDPQFCDFALYDDYVSNPHFSVRLEQTKFYVVDEGSTNGTRLNGVPIPPQRRMLLQPDAIIEVGSTRLQFKRVGGTTRQLKIGGAQPPPAPQPPPKHPPTQPQQPPSGPAAQPPAPPRPAAPMPPLPEARPGPAPQPPAPQRPPQPEPRRGGPTVKLPEEEIEPSRGGPTVKLPEEEVEPRRGGPTVKLPEEEIEPSRGGPTVKLSEEEEPSRGGPTVKLSEEEESGRGGPTVKLPEEEQSGPEDAPTVKLPRE
jgi:pSer/pThr/pTyr-binding forkhead associated (FHA) protein/Mg-chelatase subunit ChlD